eukprot:gene9846-2169_t
MRLLLLFFVLFGASVSFTLQKYGENTCSVLDTSIVYEDLKTDGTGCSLFSESNIRYLQPVCTSTQSTLKVFNDANCTELSSTHTFNVSQPASCVKIYADYFKVSCSVQVPSFATTTVKSTIFTEKDCGGKVAFRRYSPEGCVPARGFTTKKRTCGSTIVENLYSSSDKCEGSVAISWNYQADKCNKVFNCTT